jgi:carbamoyltransferase
LFEEILGGGEWPCINRSFFDADRLSQGGFSEKFYARLGLEGGEEISEALRAPLAAGLQHAIQQIVLRMAGPRERLCVAGGLGMNALLISALERSKEVFVQPAAGNAGTALGAVFYAWNNVFGQKKRASLNDLCLGPSYAAEEVKQVLENCKLRFNYLMTTQELLERAVRDLNGQKIIAWMQGRMEFGPRALGNRSILASPLNPYSTENLNIYIKHREPFRKFAASVPEEMASEYFEAGPNARYLATVGRVRAPYRGGRTIRCITSCCMRPARPTGFRCCTTPASICSAILWCVPRATRFGAFILPAWTRCSSEISWSKSN